MQTTSRNEPDPQGDQDPRRASRGWPVTDHVDQSRIDHLLVVIDEQTLMADEPRHTPLLARTANVASTMRCRVTLYAPCADGALVEALQQVEQQAEQQADDRAHGQQTVVDLVATRLAELASWLESNGISVHAKALWEPLEADVLMDRIRELEPDLVMKSGGEQRFLFGLMTHTDWELLRNAPIPIWYVTGSGDKSLIRNVLTAIGDSEHPQDVIGAHDYDVCALANLIAAESSARNTLVHAYPVPLAIPPGATFAPGVDVLPPEPVPSEPRAEAAKKHTEVIEAFARYFQLDPNDIVVRPGRLSDMIPDVTGSTAADLIVMGARNLNRWQRLLRSVNAEAVLAEAPCDILIVPRVEGRGAAGSSAPAVSGTPQLDLEAAVVNPGAVFSTPNTLALHPALSPALRRRLLDIWESDVRAEMVEEEEGGPVGPSRADLLQQIHQARQQLTGATTGTATTASQPEFS